MPLLELQQWAAMCRAECFIYSITQSTSPPTEVGIIILSPYESKRSHLRLSEIERGKRLLQAEGQDTDSNHGLPTGPCATEMWKPPAPGACSLFSLAVTCLSSTRKTEPVGLCSSHSPSETSPSLWRKTSCPPSVKIRKLSATSLANYKHPSAPRI